MKLELTALALAALAPPGAPAAEGSEAQAGRCDRSTMGSAVIEMRWARSLLLVVRPEDDGTSVSAPAGRRIEALKDRMRDFVRTMMACAPSSVEPAALAAAMEQRGGVSEGTTGDAVPPSDDRHGSLVAFEVSRVEAHPDMLAVVATLRIKCGSDSMLILYRRTPSGWREAMVRRAEPYREVKGGWGDLRFAVSPADSTGNWFVVTASTTRLVYLCLQGMPYEPARPGAAPAGPSGYSVKNTNIYLGNDGDLSLRAEQGAVEIRHEGASLDPDILIRRHVRRYEVAGNTVRRVPPVAESVRDFVDEWIVSPWTEAKDWSGPDPELARLHARIHPDHYRQLDEFASIRACGGGLTQVEIGADEGPSWFFLVRDRRESPWIMERVGRRAAAGCSGPNRLGKD